MRNTMMWTFAVGLALALVNPAAAQGRGGRGGLMNMAGMYGMGNSGVLLLANDRVQSELKITDDQKEKLREFSDAQQQKIRERMQSAFQGIGRGNQPDIQKMMETVQEEMQKYNSEAMKDVAPILKPDQLKRFKEINLQVAGIQAFVTDEELQKTLKLTDTQKESIKKMATELRQDIQELVGPAGRADPQGTQEKLKALRGEYEKKAQEKLTEEQRKSYKDMLGKPFEIQAPRGGG